MDFHAYQPVARYERAYAQLGAQVQKLYGLGAAGLCDRGAYISLLFAYLNVGPMLVQHHKARICNDVGVAHRFQGIKERAQAGVEKAEFKSAFI